MAYQQLEEQLTSRRQERIVPGVTAQQAAGIVLVALPVYLVSAGVPSAWLRIALVVVAVILGWRLATPIAGLTLINRAVWRIRGAVRRRLGTGAQLDPAQWTAHVAPRGQRAVLPGATVRPHRRVQRKGASYGIDP